MTLYELSLEYEQTAATLRGRIMELEQERRQTENERLRQQLDRRLRPLRSMYRDTRAVVRHLKGYYERLEPRRPVRSRGPWSHRRRS